MASMFVNSMPILHVHPQDGVKEEEFKNIVLNQRPGTENHSELSRSFVLAQNYVAGKVNVKLAGSERKQ